MATRTFLGTLRLAVLLAVLAFVAVGAWRDRARSRDAKHTLPLLWYQATMDRKPPYEGRNFAQGGRHSYKARGEATNRTVTAAKAVNNTAPVAPFEYVTVTL